MKINVYFDTKHSHKIMPKPLGARDITQALASAAMSIQPILTIAAFDPEATSTLGSGFDSAWSVLLSSRRTLAAAENAIVA